MLRIHIRSVFVAVGVLMAAAHVGGETTMPARGSSLPKDAAATVSELLSLSQLEFSLPRNMSWADRIVELTKAHAKFLDLLRVLDRQVDADLARKVAESGGGGIERNLIEMARDYSKHPEHYAMLLGFYEKPANPRMHILRPPELQKEHGVEEYRAAWELLLLAPCTEGPGVPGQGSTGSQFMRPTCFEAIAAIRNDSSIPVLLYLYERANAGLQGHLQHSLDEQMRVLGTLNRYCDMRSLHALLRCVAISEAVKPPLPKESGFTMKEWVVRYLRDQENYGNGRQWREVIAAALKEKLSDADRSFLQDVLKGSGQE